MFTTRSRIPGMMAPPWRRQWWPFRSPPEACRLNRPRSSNSRGCSTPPGGGTLSRALGRRSEGRPHRLRARNGIRRPRGFSSCHHTHPLLHRIDDQGPDRARRGPPVRARRTRSRSPAVTRSSRRPFSPGALLRFHRVVDLLTHTHGIGDGPVSFRVAFSGDYENDDLLLALASHPPAASGRAFRYSNLGYDLFGLLLAPGRRAAGVRGRTRGDAAAGNGGDHRLALSRPRRLPCLAV